MQGKFQLNWIIPGQQFRPGTKVEITEGYLKGEKATIEENPESQSFIQGSEAYGIEVWIRYEKDGQKAGRATLLTQWEDITHLKPI